MSYAIRIHQYGGPEVLKWEEVDVAQPGPGQIKIAHKAIGLNFIDVYHRTGLYPQPSFPFIPGTEGAGEVIAVGPDVHDLKVGDRIVYAGGMGAYSQERLIDAGRVVKLPNDISYEVAAAVMVKGMTARYLLRKTYPVTTGTRILFHAAAGGVGLIACQWAKALGATVIGTVGSAEKIDLAKANGCDHVINYKEENFVERVKDITTGQGVDVVYDAIGKDTFPASLDCLRPLGMWVSFGNSSGPVPPFEMAVLSQKGSLFATRPSLWTYTAKREDLVETANDLFAIIQSGKVEIKINQTYPLQDVARAHADLEMRKTTGSTVLVV